MLAITATSCSRYQVRDWFVARGQQIECCADGSVAHQVAVNLNEWQARNRALLRYLAAVAIPYEANWDRVAACESGGRWNLNTGNGYFGGLQFLPSTWRSVGGTGLPHQHSRVEQIRRAEILRQRAGLGQWPVCGSRWHG